MEQRGSRQAEYGDALIKRLAGDLTGRFGRGFSLAQPLSDAGLLPGLLGHFANAVGKIVLSPDEGAGDRKGRRLPTVLAKSPVGDEEPTALIERLSSAFPLPWSHYEQLLSVEDPEARRFYEQEALQGRLDIPPTRPSDHHPLLRTDAPARNKAAMLSKGAMPQPGDRSCG